MMRYWDWLLGSENDVSTKRCSVCRKMLQATFFLADSEQDGRDRNNIVHQPTFQHLEASAIQGCDICALLRQYLMHTATHAELRMSSGQVNLWRDGFGIGVDCGILGATTTRLSVSTNRQSEDEMAVGSSILADFQSSSLVLAARWVRDCVTFHPKCAKQAFVKAPRLFLQHGPRRLLDVSIAGLVRTCDTFEVFWASKHQRRSLAYTTLSYKWGAASHDCVLKLADGDLERPVSALPKTFQDAVDITKRLGVRYLWIDALCIAQDDEAEWLAESARMGQIYQHSICTIAATGADDVHQGCLLPCPAHSLPVRSCHILDESGSSRSVWLHAKSIPFAQAVNKGPLNSRGWVMQERALSPRILHCTSYGLYWECASTQASWQKPRSLQKIDTRCSSSENLLSIARTKAASHLCPVEWFHFVARYNGLDFTHKSDRLIALSSVASEVASFFGNEYAAGVWKKDLIRSLAWICTHPKEDKRSRDPYIAPTWSWASIQGYVHFSALGGLHVFRYDVAEVTKVDIMLKDPEHPYGAVTAGEVHLRGRLDTIIVQFPADKEHPTWHKQLDKMDPNRKPNTLRDKDVYFDEVQQPPDGATSRKYEVFNIGFRNQGFNFGNGWNEVLVLEPVKEDARRNVYRRIGMTETIQWGQLKMDLSWIKDPVRRAKMEAFISAGDNIILV